MSQTVGNDYVRDIPRQANPDVCPVGPSSFTDDELLAIFPNGIMSESYSPDSSTNRIAVANLQNHLRTLETTGVLPIRPTRTVGFDTETDMDGLVQNDSETYQKIHDEYCFYEQRYRYSLRQFLTLATSRNDADNSAAQRMLTITVKLNRRLNFVIEMMNYLAQVRVDLTNNNKTDINDRNRKINENLSKLNDTYSRLTRDDVIIKTQKEMIRYTTEKNNHITNQISLWASLNILALATIFYVYRS